MGIGQLRREHDGLLRLIEGLLHQTWLAGLPVASPESLGQTRMGLGEVLI